MWGTIKKPGTPGFLLEINVSSVAGAGSSTSSLVMLLVLVSALVVLLVLGGCRCSSRFAHRSRLGLCKGHAGEQGENRCDEERLFHGECPSVMSVLWLERTNHPILLGTEP